MYTIFMIEDDSGILSAIRERGAKWDLQIICCKDFHNILSDLSHVQPHLVIMDIGLPCFDGYYWCREIRKVSNVPIIFLSAMSDNMNQVMAMNMGGDDFIAKPFDSDILIAKIQALLRRTYDFAGTVPILECRGAVLNAGNSTLSYEEVNIDLTKNEMHILTVLMENKGKTVSREKLIDALWETDQYIDDNTLTVNVGRLRKKLNEHGLHDFSDILPPLSHKCLEVGASCSTALMG